MSDVLRASGEENGGALWLQRTPGKAPTYLGCVDLDDIASSQGDVALSLCRGPDGKFQTYGRSRSAPGAPTTSFTAWVFPEHSVLDDIIDARCPVYLYALSRKCGRPDNFSNYVRGLVLRNAELTSVGNGNVVKRADSGEQTVKVDVAADFPVSRVRVVKIARQDIAETTNLNTISFCDAPGCDSACGPQHDAGEEGFIGSDAPAGSPTANADVWNTEDGGSAWVNKTPGAVHPFADALDIVSSVCFDQSSATKRWLVARGTKAATPAEVAYSDNGTTWTQVTVGAVNTECAAGPHALVARDKYHIWFATSEGNVYFSDDGGATWVLLDSATASGGNSLAAMRFISDTVGYAVGENGTIIETVDGGDTWVAIADPSGGDDFTSLDVFSQYRFIAGTTVGGLWQTWNEGTSFTEQSSYPDYIATNQIKDIQFVNAVVGYMAVDTVAPVGKIYRTINGGADWDLITTPTNAGLNALAVINENLAFAVGNAQGGSGVVLKVTG